MNITVRVAGRQAQAEIRAVAKELAKIQQQAQGQAGTQTAAQQAKAAKVAAAAQAKAAKQAEAQRLKVARQATTAHNQMLRERQQYLQREWRMNVAAAQRTKAAQTAATKAAQAQQRAQTQAARAAATAARVAAAQQQRVMTQAWNRQQVAHKAHQRTLLRQQTAANAQALAQQKAHAARMAKIGGLSPLGFAKNLQQNQLVNAGKNINWVGRQLTYNFTLPLVAAGAGLFKFSMDIERSTTQLSKVYGDVTEDQTMLRKEVEALGESFKLLSTYFGINQTEVIDIAAAWAAAGSAGRGLAENTKATLETMILGDMTAQEATEGLIAIQAQWGFSTKKNADGISELTLQLAHLNSIENATGISTAGLVDVIQRAGGTARTSGAQFRELAALAAALVPATGDAAQAGTALRSIISSLMAPTAAASEALGLMGITVTDPSFMGQDVIGRLQLVAEHFNRLSDAQKGVVSSTISTKWQVSRFDVLMRQLTDPLSFYNKALEVTGEDTRSLETRQRELNAVLSSHPKQFDIMTNAMKNALADAFLPLIPALMSIVGLISDLAIAFSELDPSTQKFIIMGLGLIAVLGPIMSLLGSTMQLLGVFGSAFVSASGGVTWFIKKALFPLIQALAEVMFAFIRTTVLGLGTFLAGITATGWLIIAAIAAIAAAVIIILNTDFEEKIWDVIKSIGTALSKLPGIFGRALSATMRIVGTAVSKIGEALSYLNPFARHSPSLVDNVTAGVATILDEYKKLNRIPNMVRAASNALMIFSQATFVQGKTFREADLRKKVDETAEVAPGARPAANALVDQILSLEAVLPSVQAEINAQDLVVSHWTQALKEADQAVDLLQDSLQILEDQYKSLGDTIAEAENRIAELADTPIQGLGALEDADLRQCARSEPAQHGASGVRAAGHHARQHR